MQPQEHVSMHYESGQHPAVGDGASILALSVSQGSVQRFVRNRILKRIPRIGHPFELNGVETEAAFTQHHGAG